MKTYSLRVYLCMGLFALVIGGSLSSCSANKPRSAWMDLPHARHLDHNKGNQSRQHMKNAAHANRY